jgi:hypothetical protein
LIHYSIIYDLTACLPSYYTEYHENHELRSYHRHINFIHKTIYHQFGITFNMNMNIPLLWICNKILIQNHTFNYWYRKFTSYINQRTKTRLSITPYKFELDLFILGVIHIWNLRISRRILSRKTKYIVKQFYTTILTGYHHANIRFLTNPLDWNMTATSWFYIVKMQAWLIIFVHLIYTFVLVKKKQK